MRINPVTAQLNSDQKLNKQAHHVFVFLEVFAQEGGIQSYVQDILNAYAGLNNKCNAEVFLLRDSAENSNTLVSENLKFHYFHNQSPQIGRLKMAGALFKFIWQKRPQQVFCGHIKLAVLIKIICQPLGIPYTVLTYGKEVWQPLKHSEKQALASANAIWTISRYSRDRAFWYRSLSTAFTTTAFPPVITL